MAEKQITKQELLEKLRVAKEATGLSIQDIANLTEKNGEAVSPTTVQRLFKKGSNADDFRYSKTIGPVARAVLGVGWDLNPPDDEPTQEQAEIYCAIIDGLKAVTGFKHDMIQDQQREIEYLKSIVADYKSEIKWLRRLIAIFATIAFFAIVGVISDLLIGHIGWIRY